MNKVIIKKCVLSPNVTDCVERALVITAYLDMMRNSNF